MRYDPPGNDTSAVEVTNVSKHGLWLLIREKEVFLPFEKFPWFRDAPIGKVIHVELPSHQHLYWPELDIDLEVDSVLYPERYPLVSSLREVPDTYAPQDSAVPSDQDRLDDTVLALMQLTLHDTRRAWKGFDFGVLDRLYEKGYLLNPANKNKSIVLTDEGLERSDSLFKEFFEKQSGKR